MKRFGSIAKGTKPHHLGAKFNDLTNSAAPNLSTKLLDMRLKMALDMEDPDIIVDLRELNENNNNKYLVFWDAMQRFLTDQTAVDDRRQTEVTYMAIAFSVHDLVQQVAELCPEGTPIPSEKWVTYQFHHKHPNTAEAQRYRKRFNLRMMVQQRLLRLTHEDSHYCAAYFKSFILKC